MMNNEHIYVTRGGEDILIHMHTTDWIGKTINASCVLTIEEAMELINELQKIVEGE